MQGSQLITYNVGLRAYMYTVAFISQCLTWHPWHILSWLYNCTKHGNRPIDIATTARFTLHISILQLHKLCTLKYALMAPCTCK